MRGKDKWRAGYRIAGCERLRQDRQETMLTHLPTLKQDQVKADNNNN